MSEPRRRTRRWSQTSTASRRSASRHAGRSTGMSNEDLNRWYDLGIEHGALGGKLVGAGGGGFLLFYTRERARLRDAMRAEGLTEVRFSFDHDGSTLIVRD